MNTLFVAALLAVPAALQSPADSPRPLSTKAPPSVRALRTAFTEAVEDSAKSAVLDELRRTTPTEPGDVQALFDLFMRFPDERVRAAVIQSMELAPRPSPTLEPVVVRYLEDPEEPATVLLAIKAAVRLRAREALPILRRLAAKKFAHRSAEDGAGLAERNSWWVQYEALAALAQWDGKNALPLLLQKSRESPRVGRLLGIYLWPEALPTLADWAAGSEEAQARAREGLDAPTPPAALRATRDEMIKRMRDKKAPKLLRHKLAVKIGMSSEPAEVTQLLAERQAEKDGLARELLATAIFASRDKQALPLLVEYLRTHPHAGVRVGALVQLHDMLPASELRPHLEWAAKNDPDPENRVEFAKNLAELK